MIYRGNVMRVAISLMLAAFLATSGYVVGLAQARRDPEIAREYTVLLGPKYEHWNVLFGPLVGLDGDDRYTYWKPGQSTAYPRPEDGMILKCHPRDGTQYCALIGIRKKK